MDRFAALVTIVMLSVTLTVTLSHHPVPHSSILVTSFLWITTFNPLQNEPTGIRRINIYSHVIITGNNSNLSKGKGNIYSRI